MFLAHGRSTQPFRDWEKPVTEVHRITGGVSALLYSKGLSVPTEKGCASIFWSVLENRSFLVFFLAFCAYL